MAFLPYNNKEDFVHYRAKLSNKQNKTTIIFFHGLCSNTESTKSLFIENFCINNNINYIVFDYYAHGKASGNYDNLTFEKALESCYQVIDNLVEEQCIIVGSSFGCWLGTYLTTKRNEKVKGLILIAPAIDFSLFILNNLSNFKKTENGDIIKTSERGDFIINKKLLENTEKYFLTTGNDLISINKPIRILQGMEDTSVPYKTSLDLVKKFQSEDVNYILVKNMKHNFSNEACLNIIQNNILELYNQIK